MKNVSVTIFRRNNQGSYFAQWFDPLTGKRRRQSTGTPIRRDAERFAAKLETDINEGRRSSYSTLWSDFCDRYRAEVGNFRSPATQVKIEQAFNHVKKHIAPKFLRSMDAGELSKLSARLAEDNLSQATIGSILRTLKAALRWAASLDLIPKAPKITMPTGAGKASGRPLTDDEFQELLKVARESSGKPAVVASRVRFLAALWWSGLRLQEATRLHWTDDQFITVSFRGKRPMFDIKSEADKARKDRLFPMAPEFAEMLLEVPKAKRQGFVLPWLSEAGEPLGFDDVSRAIAALGRKAKIVVDHTVTGKAVHASAHDLRRSFGTRWAKLVLPPVLKQLMRHASITTTMTYYVDISAEEATESLYSAISKAAASGAESGADATSDKKADAVSIGRGGV